jgi:hypothetical protein
MNSAALPLELHDIEKLREAELEEARAIQSVMLPAESVLFCTDGITEAFDHDGEQFGIERAARALRCTSARVAHRIAGPHIRRSRDFSGRREQHDDMAAAVFQFCGGVNIPECAYKSM